MGDVDSFFGKNKHHVLRSIVTAGGSKHRWGETCFMPFAFLHRRDSSFGGTAEMLYVAS